MSGLIRQEISAGSTHQSWSLNLSARWCFPCRYGESLAYDVSLCDALRSRDLFIQQLNTVEAMQVQSAQYAACGRNPAVLVHCGIIFDATLLVDLRQ
jgi:hypothetical protein